MARRENGNGSIFKLSGNRRRPWAVRITAGWEGKKQIYKFLGYYPTKEEAELALIDFYKTGVIEEKKRHHYETHSRLYNIWVGMRNRCNDSKAISYKYYGAKGVAVCDEWEKDYRAFSKWAHDNGYRDDLTLDRIDPYGNYEPSNCRWATWKEQAQNKRKEISQ